MIFLSLFLQVIDLIAVIHQLTWPIYSGQTWYNSQLWWTQGRHFGMVSPLSQLAPKRDYLGGAIVDTFHPKGGPSDNVLESDAARLEKIWTWDVGPTLVYCWASVVDTGPTVNQLWADVSSGWVGHEMTAMTLHFAEHVQW